MMTAPKKAPSTGKRKPAAHRHVPKGSYVETIDPRYVEARDQATLRVAQNMKRRLAEKGIVARDVAKTMGLSLAVVRDRYQAKTPWALEEIAGLAVVFDLDVVDILTGEETMEDRMARIEREHREMMRRLRSA
jgi:hypothetical protein